MFRNILNLLVSISRSLNPALAHAQRGPRGNKLVAPTVRACNAKCNMTLSEREVKLWCAYLCFYRRIRIIRPWAMHLRNPPKRGVGV